MSVPELKIRPATPAFLATFANFHEVMLWLRTNNCTVAQAEHDGQNLGLSARDGEKLILYRLAVQNLRLLDELSKLSPTPSILIYTP